jgi:ATP-dependent Clp protease ATP-binding subunit ClpC
MRSETPDYKEARQLVLREVKKFFKPEFLNRLDDTIVFHYLESAEVKQIAAMFVEELEARMRHRSITLAVDNAAIDKLARDGFDPAYGARPLRREVERQVENPLAMMIVKGECPDGSRVTIGLTDEKIRLTVR